MSPFILLRPLSAARGTNFLTDGRLVYRVQNQASPKGMIGIECAIFVRLCLTHGLGSAENSRQWRAQVNGWSIRALQQLEIEAGCDVQWSPMDNALIEREQVQRDRRIANWDEVKAAVFPEFERSGRSFRVWWNCMTYRHGRC